MNHLCFIFILNHFLEYSYHLNRFFYDTFLRNRENTSNPFITYLYFKFFKIGNLVVGILYVFYVYSNIYTNFSNRNRIFNIYRYTFVWYRQNLVVLNILWVYYVVDNYNHLLDVLNDFIFYLFNIFVKEI